MKTHEAIRSIRKKLGLTQQQLANTLGLAVSSVARYEAGSRPEYRILRLLYDRAVKLDAQEEAKSLSDVLFAHDDIDQRVIFEIFERAKNALEIYAIHPHPFVLQDVMFHLLDLCCHANPGLAWNLPRVQRPSERDVELTPDQSLVEKDNLEMEALGKLYGENLQRAAAKASKARKRASE